MQCGHIVLLSANDRVPADLLLLRTPEKGGAVFIRTDQLDGETDWKLKNAPSLTQSLAHDQQLTSRGRSDKLFSVQAEPPSLEIYKFSGVLNCGSSISSSSSSGGGGGGGGDADGDTGTSCVDSEVGGGCEQESLSIENVLWCNTVLCSSAAVGCVIYTGHMPSPHV